MKWWEAIKHKEQYKGIQEDYDKAVEYAEFNGHEDRYCSTFGCGRRLSLTEQLHGTKCIHHQQININHEFNTRTKV